MLEIDKERLAGLDPEQAAEVLELLERIEEIGENSPISLYFPHDKQKAFHSFDKRFKCFFGGNQSGKTTAGLADDLIQALSEDFLPSHLLKYKHYQPPFYARIFTTDLITLQLTLLEKLRAMVPQEALMGGAWEKAYDKQLRILRFAPEIGSIFQFMTYEQEPKRMGGATLHRVHYDEEPPRKIRAENTMRVMKLGGDEILTMTPLEGFTWTYDEVYEPTLNEGKKLAEYAYETENIGMVMVDIEDNPAITKDSREYTLSQYVGEEQKARKTGRFIPLEGMIYNNFDANIHIINSHSQLPDNVNVIVGIDPGIGEAMGVVWAYLDASDRMVVFEELFLTDQTIAQATEQIHSLNEYWNVNPIYYVIDPASRNRNPQTGRSDQMTFADNGVVTIPGQNDVRAGLNMVKMRLEEQELFIWDSCVNIIREFKKYRWKPQRTEMGDGKPRPVKRDDHLLDALRYVVMSRPYMPKAPENRKKLDRLQESMIQDQQRAATRKKTNKSEFGGIYR